jgi:hypothetical protein
VDLLIFIVAIALKKLIVFFFSFEAGNEGVDTSKYISKLLETTTTATKVTSIRTIITTTTTTTSTILANVNNDIINHVQLQLLPPETGMA